MSYLFLCFDIFQQRFNRIFNFLSPKYKDKSKKNHKIKSENLLEKEHQDKE